MFEHCIDGFKNKVIITMSNQENTNENNTENVEQVSDEAQSLEDQAIAEGECCNTGCGDACVSW